jgi:hypothetical protein
VSWLPATWNANLVVWALIWGGLWGFQALALVTRPTLPSFGDLILAIQRSRLVRAFLLAGWAWWGWHVFVRGGW